LTRFDLSHLDEAYDKAPLETGSGNVPDGKYTAKVARAFIAESKRSGDPMLKWELTIIAGDYEGRKLFRNNMLANEENLKFLKKDLNTCGMTLNRLSELGNRTEELLDIVVEVQKKTNGEYENVYLNKRIDVDDDGVPGF
jgi:hypothetical protein